MNGLIRNRVERYHRFYASNKPGDLLIVNRPAWVKKKNLFEYDFENGGHLEMAADIIHGARVLLEMNGELDDDLIPWLIADFGIATLHAFLIDVPIQFAEWTSWAPHPLSGPDGYKKLSEIKYDPDNKWVRRTREMLAFWREQYDGTFLPMTNTHFGPLDLANSLRGNQLFTDFFDQEDEVRTLLNCCTEAIIRYEEDLRQVAGPWLGEYGMPFWGALAPCSAVFLSEDAMDLSGPTVSEEWGMPYTERIREHFGCIAVHHHMYGRPVHSLIGREVRNSLVQISNDPNCPPAMDMLCELYEASGGNALMVDCTPEEVAAHREELKHIRAILICGNADREKGRQVVDLVRSISNIH